MRDLNAIRATQAQERAPKVKKNEDDKHKGEEMRQAAMEVLSSKFADFTSVLLFPTPISLSITHRKEEVSSRGTIFYLFISVNICGWRCQ